MSRRLHALSVVLVLALGALVGVRWALGSAPGAVTIAMLAVLALGTAAWSLFLVRNAFRNADALASHIAEQRLLSQTLEQQVAVHSEALDDAQRVLQRMWRLGQQIAGELNAQRVLDRFLEAVVDVAQADGGAVGLVGDDGRIRIVGASGDGALMVGHHIPVGESVMGRVVRVGARWVTEDAQLHRHDLYEGVFGLMTQPTHGMAIMPVSRRGERIGAVALFAREQRVFSPQVLERVEAMADLLAVALENAELVDTMRQTEWRFRTLFRAAPDVVLTILSSGRIREVNDAAREVFGVDPIQLVGRTLADLALPADREALEETLREAFAGRAGRAEVRMAIEGDASVKRVVSFAASRLPQADPPTLLLVGRDVTTEREMRMRLMESDRLAAVGELVAGVAHEVNNPLSSISAFAQLLLRDEGLNATQRDSLEVIRSETQRASQVVKDLLAFARRSEPQQESLDLNLVLTRSLKMRGYQLDAADVKVELELADRLPAVVGDGRQLQQVCLNLLTNAVQAMEGRGIGTLVIRTRAEGDQVLLEMRDTGPGISDEVRARVFEPFFTTKPEGEGTGLGLSVSYGIIAAHGGTIAVAETSSAGTTFRVTLPAGEAPASQRTQRDSGQIVLRSPLSGLRLLFVDDEPALRASMQKYGKIRGFDVVTANDGASALAVLEETGVDVIVCDLRMPGMDGPTFHEALRRTRPGLAARTVFITGDVVSAATRGIVRQPIVTKPFAFERLEEAMVGVLRGRAYASPSVITA
ncbi:MAG: multi-sensor hybrid histidine kinase [Gemmatimonadetes bacterium]|nr:multi-sensor hybrid histidine kinase [Gemmatimonadota bacterium]